MKILDLRFNQVSNSFSDISGNSISISKTGTFKKSIPMCPESTSSLLVESSNSITLNNIPIATRSHESEAFSIGLYFKAGDKFTSSEQNILYDTSSGLGLVFQDGIMTFRVTDSTDSVTNVSYRLNRLYSSYYVVARYSPGLISLMLDGNVVASSQVKYDFKFKSTTSLDLNSSVSSSHILLDKIQIFNYDLNTREIINIMSEDALIHNPGQIISSDNGIFFEPNYSNKPLQAGFSYKTNKNFLTAEMNNVEITDSGNIVLSSATIGPNSGYIKDSFFFPPLSESSHNIISWNGDSGGIEVGYNTDGGSVYTPVENNSNISNFTGGDFYYKVDISTPDASIDKPVFTGLSFLIYDNKYIDSRNSLYRIESDYDYVVGDRLIPNSHGGYSGMKTIGGGFRVEDLDVRSVEFFYNPSALGATCLIDCGGARLSWSSGGTITKNNISSIYVNGQNVTSESSVSDIFTAGVWHHVVITLSSNEQEFLYLNQTSDGQSLGPDSRFNYIAIYDYDVSTKAIEHYNYMTSKVSILGASESIEIGSDNFSGFNIDKIVISTQ